MNLGKRLTVMRLVTGLSTMAMLAFYSTSNDTNSTNGMSFSSWRQEQHVERQVLVSPLEVTNDIAVSSDTPKKYGAKEFGSMLPESYRQNNYCEIDSKDHNMQCRQVLGQSALKSKPHWHFFGDSQMATMVLMLSTHHYPYEVTIKKGEAIPTGRCELGKYFNMRMSDVWRQPDEKRLQGPVVYGKDNPFCSDMNGWGPYKIGDGKRSLEFLNVEFAQDVEIQTATTTTTQEAAALYLKNDNKEDHVCVVNAGLHDQAVPKSPDVPQDQFVNNVKSYLKLLDSVCGNLVWVGITEVRELDPTRFPQRNAISLKWNKEVYSMIASTFPNNSFIIDVWDESVAAPFKGAQNIHYTRHYYDKFATLFASLV
mmetsp:Transcript_7795/g.11881  ORF Transcript_7795/g.11881 Transcript_7795/m.11881 type:complete len:368 (+) Transcript_7795:87-1190(+)